jgi:hypothetical protein
MSWHLLALVHKLKSRRNPSVGLERLGGLVTLGHAQVCHLVESRTPDERL